jgi:hypothetical protein
MDWDYVLTLKGSSLLPVGTLRCQNLAIELTVPNQSKTWFKAGYLVPLINVSGGDIPAQDILIRFGAQIIQIPYSAYKLRFIPVPYLPDRYTLKLLKLPMSISYPSSIPVTANAGTVTAVTPSANSATIVQPNTTRLLGGMIINKTNKRLWIRYDTIAATTAAPCIDIPPNGGSTDIPDGYVGQVTGIWEAAPVGTCTVIEYLSP